MSRATIQCMAVSTLQCIGRAAGHELWVATAQPCSPEATHLHLLLHPVPAIIHQVAVGLAVAAPHAAAQLVQLRKPKALCGQGRGEGWEDEWVWAAASRGITLPAWHGADQPPRCRTIWA